MQASALSRLQAMADRHLPLPAGAVNADKVARLAESMRADGWDGPPLVVNSLTAEVYTGVHRLAAVETLKTYGTEVLIPVYDVEADFRADDYRDSEELAEALRAIDSDAADLVAAEGE